MRIAEIFHSIQGEGKLAGTPSTFIRTSGCNLRCTWCDTPYASWNPEGPDLTLPQILAQIPPASTHIVLTGGEPMMFKELVPLISALKSQNKHITLETAGTLWLDDLPPNAIDLASISPKLSNSTPITRENGRFAQAHEKHRLNLPVLRTFATHPAIVDRQWKFVISSDSDIAEAESLITQINADLPEPAKIPPSDILLMPEGIDAPTILARSQWLAPIAVQKNFSLSPRLHILLYGNTRGT